MNADTIEKLRPLPADPGPDWSAATLRSITAADVLDETSPTRPVLGMSRRSAGRPRWGVALIAACAVVVLTCVGVPAALHLWSRPILADPARAVDPTLEPLVSAVANPLAKAEETELVQSCRDDADPSPVVAVHYARAFANTASAAPPVQAAVVSDERGEYRVCVLPHSSGRTSSMISGFGPKLLGPTGQLTPDKRHPLRELIGCLRGHSRRPDQIRDVELLVGYATAPDVDRVRVQVSSTTGDHSSWFEGRAAGGFVIIPVAVPSVDAPDLSDPDLIMQARAYDTEGRLVATVQQDDLDGSSHGNSSFWEG